MQLRGKTAIVTGGTHSIDAATAIQLAQQGAGIALIACNEGDGTVQKKLKRWVYPNVATRGTFFLTGMIHPKQVISTPQ